MLKLVQNQNKISVMLCKSPFKGSDLHDADSSSFFETSNFKLDLNYLKTFTFPSSQKDSRFERLIELAENVSVMQMRPCHGKSTVK